MDWRYLVHSSLCASIAFLLFGCQPGAKPPPISSPLNLRIVYHEEHCLLGLNVRSVDGVGEYVFENVSEKPITVVLPPSRVLFVTYAPTENMVFLKERLTARRELAEEDWPEFLRKPASFTLAPGDKQIFRSRYSMDLPKSANKK